MYDFLSRYQFMMQYVLESELLVTQSPKLTIVFDVIKWPTRPMEFPN